VSVPSAVEIADGLAERGWVVGHDLLPVDALEALAAEARRLFEEGRFGPAAVGRGRGRGFRPDVRGDQVFWLDPRTTSEAETRYWEAVEGLRLDLNRLLYLGLAELEAHLAVFPAGAFYAKHLDRFATSEERTLSLTLYLNPGWKKQDGGELRLHVEGGPVDVLPEMGTFALFRSEAVWHEVLAARAPRFSATGWYRRRPRVPA